MRAGKGHLEKPKTVLSNLERRTVTLFFENREPSEFLFRGGITWPQIVERAGAKDFEGFALLAGLNIKTKIVEIFEQRSFLTIEHILEQRRQPQDSPKIEYYGLGPWFTKLWNRYRAKTFFWFQDFELNKRYLLEVLRSEWIVPKPAFIEVPWVDDSEAQMLVWRYVKFNKIRIEKESQLAQDLMLVQKGEKETMPSVHALQCLLTGLDRFAIKEQKQERVTWN